MRSATARSGLTLLGLVVLVVVASWWGWSAMTKPFPKEEPVPLCVDQTVTAGSKVSRDQVVVSVFNASRRQNLASATQKKLLERGFVAGRTGNAPKPSEKTQIWAADPKDPSVILVKRQFRGAKVVTGRTALAEGVVVVVGQKFTSLRPKKVKSVKVSKDTIVCIATGTPDPDPDTDTPD